MDIVIFGCGSMGRYVAKGLREHDIKPLCFAVDKPDKIYVDKVKIYSITQAATTFPGALFVVAAFQGAEVLKRLIGMGLMVITFPKFARHYAPYLLPYYALDNKVYLPADRVDLFADEESRTEYIGQYKWRGTLDSYYLPLHQPIKDLYFPPDLVDIRQDEVFVDCGAYDGDTIGEFKQHGGGKIIAIEPDPGSYEKLISKYPDIIAINQALGTKCGKIAFDAYASPWSASGKGESLVDCDTLDNILAGYKPTFIKMDIEGAELDALKGGCNTIKVHRPVLAICLYHRPYDIWQIPVYVHWLVPSYKLYLRRYAEDCWEEVLYCIPPERVK
jgi:FkbM family methyltransferase